MVNPPNWPGRSTLGWAGPRPLADYLGTPGLWPGTHLGLRGAAKVTLSQPPTPDPAQSTPTPPNWSGAPQERASLP